MNNKSLYRNLPHISTKIQQIRMRFAGHCCRHENEVEYKVVLWMTIDGKNQLRKKKEYMKSLI